METIGVVNRGLTNKVCGTIRLPRDITVRVPLSFIGEFGYDPDLHFAFNEIADQLKSRNDADLPYFDFWCLLSSVDGYGRHALDIWKGLSNLECEVALRSGPFGVHEQFLDPNVKAQTFISRRRPPAKVSVCMTVPYDPMLQQSQSVTRIGITQFETDHFPTKHVEAVNSLNHLIVTSSFQPAMMRKSGIKVPISVLTPGIDTEAFPYKDREFNGKFKVLMLGALTGRKDPIGAMDIFAEASEGNPDWSLTIKTRQAGEVDAVRRRARMDSRVNMIVSDSHPKEVVHYYHTHDCLLWPSKGEGVGLPPLEAMCTGMEVVCADNSGMSDFLSNEWAWPIRTAGMEPADVPGGFSQQYVEAFGSVGRWWVPDRADAVRQLKRCFSAWRDSRGKGQKAAQYVREHHTLDIQARSVLKVVKSYL